MTAARDERGSGVVRPPATMVPWSQMTRAQLAHGVLLAMKAAPVFGPRWTVAPKHLSYDPASDVVVVALPGVGETWSMVHGTEAETMVEIDRRFGTEGVLRAKAVVELVPA